MPPIGAVPRPAVLRLSLLALARGAVHAATPHRNFAMDMLGGASCATSGTCGNWSEEHYKAHPHNYFETYHGKHSCRYGFTSLEQVRDRANPAGTFPRGPIAGQPDCLPQQPQSACPPH